MMVSSRMRWNDRARRSFTMSRVSVVNCIRYLFWCFSSCTRTRLRYVFSMIYRKYQHVQLGHHPMWFCGVTTQQSTCRTRRVWEFIHFNSHFSYLSFNYFTANPAHIANEPRSWVSNAVFDMRKQSPRPKSCTKRNQSKPFRDHTGQISPRHRRR